MRLFGTASVTPCALQTASRTGKDTVCEGALSNLTLTPDIVRTSPLMAPPSPRGPFTCRPRHKGLPAVFRRSATLALSFGSPPCRPRPYVKAPKAPLPAILDVPLHGPLSRPKMALISRRPSPLPGAGRRRQVAPRGRRPPLA